MADYALTASVVSRFIGCKCPENGEAAVECWGEFADAVGPALPFLVRKDALRRIPFRELGLPCVELGSMIPQQGEMWVLFCFRDALRDRACADAGIRTDGFALVLEWRKGASDSALLSRAFHALADLVRRQQKVEGWGLHPAYARYGDNVDFTDADLFADDAGRASVASAFGALAAGLYCAVRNKRLSRWPFPTLQWDEKRGRIVGVAGLREKMSVAIDCGAKVITVAKEQRDGAEKILGELKASANGLSTESARIGVVAVRTDVKANSVGKAILCAVERSWLILRIILYVVVFLSCGLAVGFFGLFKFLDRGRADLQLAVVQCQTDYDELRHSYRYVPWRTEFFANVSNMIHELNEKLRQPFIGRTEASCAVGRVQVLLKEIESLDEERIKLEKTAFDMINPAKKALRKMVGDLPVAFEMGNSTIGIKTKKSFVGTQHLLDDISRNLLHTNQIDMAYLRFIEKHTALSQSWVEFDYKTCVKTWFAKFDQLKIDDSIDAFLIKEIAQEKQLLDDLSDKDRDRCYYERIMKAKNLYDDVKFYKSDLTEFLLAIDNELAFMRHLAAADVQLRQLKEIRSEVVRKFKIHVINRSPKCVLAELVEGAKKQRMKVGNSDEIPKYDAESIKLLREKAERGDAEAQHNLGACYWWGEGVKKDSAEAAKWFREAAKHGMASAQNALGLCYWNADGLAKDYVEAVKWFRRAAEQNFVAAQYMLGLCYENGHGVESDAVEAVKWYRKAAERGDVEAQFSLGVCYESAKGVSKDLVEAMKWWHRAAEQGLADAQCTLGLCYINATHGVAKNEVEAVKWLGKAAEQGYAIAQYNLGLCYAKGEGLSRNMGEAIKWYRKAAEQGNASAQLNLGVCYCNGEGVQEDKVVAMKWFCKAAEQGDANAQTNLGRGYFNGEGVSRDTVEAMKWYRKAAEQGNANAQYMLGWAYWKGEGVSVNMSESVKWMRKAAEQGHPEASRVIQSVKVIDGSHKEMPVRVIKQLETQDEIDSETQDEIHALCDGGRTGGADVGVASASNGRVNEEKFNVEYAEYVIRNGDYLAKISKKFQVPIAVIKKMNPSITNEVVLVGQKIKLPAKIDINPAITGKANPPRHAPYFGPTKEYVVKSGDTLGSIAYGNGITIRQFNELNKLTTDILRVGQTVLLPDRFIKTNSKSEANDTREGWMFR